MDEARGGSAGVCLGQLLDLAKVSVSDERKRWCFAKCSCRFCKETPRAQDFTELGIAKGIAVVHGRVLLPESEIPLSGGLGTYS
jgi:hypothetical protein